MVSRKRKRDDSFGRPGDVWGQISVGVDGTIFPVLAPVLRPGRPLPEVPGDPPFYVSRRDAAEMQG
ncbi:hypothetical protein ACFQFC_29700 [Amorphoplanes digitatis]|uniref:Uncharacterized protein n=1 Tax=Actinoplanes digitatis TaxID=1868 RepID=A0A7W7HT56_9ACTN|nr:hypothetical protein [Actinoplanes digitatis]MBB4760322.1 hypothetical protein [Actinoplanes digitatis]GID97495.1 hypothetical protein Adi01nite_69070 [Actinoplanes digitatis]